MKRGDKMKLNPDCLRDILLVIEESTSYTDDVDSDKFALNSKMDKYSYEEVFYHVRQADLSNLLYKTTFFKGGFIIQDLSPEGHKFLNDIRNDNNWTKTKEVAKKTGSLSLDALKIISANIISSLVKQNLGLE